jgi:hypothetical protein
MEAEDFFAGHPLGVSVLHKLRSVLSDLGDVQVRVSKSQIAFRRKRGFAYLWMPSTYLRRPAAEVVLSIALGRHDESSRFKQVAHPTPKHWIHHLELHDAADIDGEVAAWMREAAERAG